MWGERTALARVGASCWRTGSPTYSNVPRTPSFSGKNVTASSTAGAARRPGVYALTTITPVSYDDWKKDVPVSDGICFPRNFYRMVRFGGKMNTAICTHGELYRIASVVFVVDNDLRIAQRLYLLILRGHNDDTHVLLT